MGGGADGVHECERKDIGASTKRVRKCSMREREKKVAAFACDTPRDGMWQQDARFED